MCCPCVHPYCDLFLAECHELAISCSNGILQCCVPDCSLARYPVVETQRVSDVLAEQYAGAVCRRAEELVTELHHQTSPLDTTLLRSAHSN